MQLDAYSSGEKAVLLSVHDYKTAIEEVVVTAHAEALASAADYKNSEGCMAWVNASGCVGDECFECKAGAVSAGAIEEIDAVANASAPPQHACSSCTYMHVR